MNAILSADTSQLHSIGVRGGEQLGLPVEIRPEEIARERTLGGAIELCAKVAGYDLDKQLATDLGVDKAQFSRWTNGTEGVIYPKLRKLMDRCGNDAPVLWMFHDRGYDLHSVHRRETAIERENRELREEVTALRRALRSSV